MIWKDLYKLSQSNAIFIEGIPDVFMKSVYAAQLTLWATCETLLDKLDTENGDISNSKKNRKLIAAFAATYELFRQSAINTVIDDLLGYSNTVLHNNFNYYDSMLNFDQEFAASSDNFDTFDSSGDPYQEKSFMQALTDATESINFRLGLTSAGILITGGYLYNLYRDTTVPTAITQSIYKGMISGTPLTDMKTTLQSDVVGETEQLPNEEEKVTKNGLIGKVWSPVANDVFTQVDRTASTVIANATDLKYFIYSGTIRKNSRAFCIERCNKVYDTEEAKDWVNASPGPIAIDPETYDPVIDCGGINCYHTCMFISSELYKVLVDQGSDLIPA